MESFTYTSDLRLYIKLSRFMIVMNVERWNNIFLFVSRLRDESIGGQLRDQKTSREKERCNEK